MKRKNKLHYRSIKSTVYYTIRGIILLPIRLVLLPFKLIGRAVFYSKPKQILTLGGLRSINRRIFKNSNDINNLFKSFTDLHCDSIDEVNKRLKKLDDKIDTHMNCFNGSESSHLLYLIAESERKINEIELSLDSYNSLFNSFKDLLLRVSNIENNMRPKDLGTFNFINDKLTQPELDIIEAEAKGESVAREEYDYTSEQKAKDKQVQDRMRKDEAELIW